MSVVIFNVRESNSRYYYITEHTPPRPQRGESPQSARILKLREEFAATPPPIPVEFKEMIELSYKKSELFDASIPVNHIFNHPKTGWSRIHLNQMLNWIIGNGWTIHTFNTISNNDGGSKMHTILFQKTSVENKPNPSLSVDCDILNELANLKNEMEKMKRLMSEEKSKSQESKRKFACAIAKMVQSEMASEAAKAALCASKDELGHCVDLIVQLRLELNEVKEYCRYNDKSLSKKAASEAAKVALSASKFIKLRLLMF